MVQGNTDRAVWSTKQTYVLGIICLIIGATVGYVLRGSSPVRPHVQQDQSAQAAQQAQGPMPPTPEQLKPMADKKVEPLLEKLKQNPKDPVLLAQIGNAYYDAQQLETAISYYEQSLAIDPKQATVRTDMGSAYCRSGQVERGIREFETVLKYDPTHDNAYLNLGMVKWQAMHDANGAIGAWRQLLAHNPRYAKRPQLEQMIARLESAAGTNR